jgi:hypothetical protein
VLDLGHEFFPASGRATRILDFDIENRPLSYWQPDRPTAEITAIASCWADDVSSMRVALLYPNNGGQTEMFRDFTERYNEADIVTGHYIRRHDLPIINGALYELGLPLLGPKLTCDTKLDMFTKADIPATQEYLLEVLRITDLYGQPVAKFHMTQGDWREANRLTAAGLAKTAQRVQSDVFAHMQLRLRMLALGMLKPPSMWVPGGAPEITEGRHR